MMDGDRAEAAGTDPMRSRVAGAALPVSSRARYRLRDTGGQHRGAGDVSDWSPACDTACDDVVDACGVDVRAREHRPQGLGEQGHRVHARERAPWLPLPDAVRTT
jgi:hypothetical protein